MALTGEKTEVLGEEHFLESLRLPQISHGLNWDRNRTCAVRGSPLNANVKTRSLNTAINLSPF